MAVVVWRGLGWLTAWFSWFAVLLGQGREA